MFDHDFHFGFNFIDPEEPAPCRLTAIGVETDWHPEVIHNNADRNIWTYIFLYTLQGSCVVETEDEKKQIIKKNDAAFLFMPSNSRYYTSPDSKELWRYFYIMFIVDKMTKPYCNEIIETVGHVFTLSPDSYTITSAVDLITKRRSGLMNHAKLSYAAVYDFLCKLYYDTTKRDPHYSIVIQDAIRIMEERYAKLNGIQELASFLNLSMAHFTRKFTTEVGVSPIKYLTKIRLDHALFLLAYSNDSIQEIAISCGFESSSYFTRTFKKNMSISPSEYRRQNSK